MGNFKKGARISGSTYIERVADVVLHPTFKNIRISSYPKDKDDELYNSIKTHGIIPSSPITVEENDGKLYVTEAFNRHRIVLRCVEEGTYPLKNEAGEPVMAVYYKNGLSEQDKIIKNIQENISAALTGLDKAYTCYRLALANPKLTQSEISLIVYGNEKSTMTVSNNIMLFEYASQNVIEALKNGTISYSKALAIVRGNNIEKQDSLLTESNRIKLSEKLRNVKNIDVAVASKIEKIERLNAKLRNQNITEDEIFNLIKSFTL